MTVQSFKLCIRSASVRPLTHTMQEVRSLMTIGSPSPSKVCCMVSCILPEMHLHDGRIVL